MKKKTGFTLAEVLVTLGIVGVIAALTVPALVQSVGTAKIGPALSKAFSSFNVANEALLSQEEAPSLTSIIGTTGGSTEFDTYLPILQDHMKVSEIDSTQQATFNYYKYKGDAISSNIYKVESLDDSGNEYVLSSSDSVRAFSSDDGFIYFINLCGAPITYEVPEEKNEAGEVTKPAHYAYDPDLAENQFIGDVWIDINGRKEPNRIGKDLFRFVLYNNGFLKPFGAEGSLRFLSVGDEKTYLYTNSTNGCNTTVLHGDTCSGSIFSNGLVITYK